MRSLFKIYGLFLFVLHFSVRPNIKKNKIKNKTKQKEQILLEVSFFSQRTHSLVFI